MPWKAKRPCRYAGCPATTHGTYCREHCQGQEVAVSSGPGNPVQSNVLRLSASAAILQTERRLAAIEYALARAKRLDGTRARLVQLKYFDNRLTDIGIMEELCISCPSFHRWRREFICLVAERLGREV